MKRFFVFLLVLCLLTVQSFAIDIYSEYFQVVNGNTYLGTFATNPLTDLQKDNLRSFLDNDLSFILADDDSTHFYLLSLGNENGFTVDYIYNNCCSIVLGCNVSGSVWRTAGDGILVYDSVISYSAGDEIDAVVIIGGRAFGTCDITFPSPIANYVADYEGALMLTDDGGLMSDPVSDGSDSEQSGILSFLTDFWETFKSFLIGLFVPSDGYFSSWYSDIKTAFDAKLGGITSLYNQLTGFFNGIKIADHTIMCTNYDGTSFKFFNDALFGDIFAFIKPVITGFLVLCCWFFCYRKIIGFVKD